MTPQEMYALAKELFPLCRSITGEGTRATLRILQRELPGLRLFEVPSGTQAFDWTVPQEWRVREAYLEDEAGRRIVDFAQSNLNLVGYSEPTDCYLSLEELQPHLYSLPEQPDWVPYVTSYYKRRWGFCMTQRQRDALHPGRYHAVVDADLFDGSLTYGELLLPGRTRSEVLLSTYVCHPSMANNELSGPCVAAALAQWLSAMPQRRYTYRIVFVPETIGSITYLSRHLEEMRQNTVAGFNLSCLGDTRAYSYVPSRKGDTLADRAALSVLTHHAPDFVRYTFLDRGSDERQYNAPGVGLPVCSVTRSKFGAYPEYHTSADNLSLISAQGLGGSLEAYQKILSVLEHNYRYQMTCPCEPQLGKRGLYPTASYKGSSRVVKTMMDLIAYADGTQDLIGISEAIGAAPDALVPLVQKLMDAGLMQCADREE